MTGRGCDGWRKTRHASSSTAPNPNRLAIAPTNGIDADDLQDDQAEHCGEVRSIGPLG